MTWLILLAASAALDVVIVPADTGSTGAPPSINTTVHPTNLDFWMLKMERPVTTIVCVM